MRPRARSAPTPVFAGFGCPATRLRAETGATLVFVSLIVSSLALMVCFVADVGLSMLQKSRLQNAADISALGGAMALGGGTGAAKKEASDLASANGFAPGGPDVSVQENRVTVTLATTEKLLIGGFGSPGSKTLTASAVGERIARKSGLRPFGLADQLFIPGQVYVLKPGTGAPSMGQYRALALESMGSRTYLEDLQFGASRKVQVGDVVDGKSGNQTGPTDKGVEYVLATGNPRIVAAIVAPSGKGKSSLTVVRFEAFDLISSAGGEVTGRSVGPVISAVVEATVFGSKLVQ